MVKFLCVSSSPLSGSLAIDRGWLSLTWLMADDSSHLHSVGPRLSLGRLVALSCAPHSILSLLTLHFWIKFASRGRFPFIVSHVPKETSPESLLGGLREMQGRAPPCEAFPLLWQTNLLLPRWKSSDLQGRHWCLGPGEEGIWLKLQ